MLWLSQILHLWQSDTVHYLTQPLQICTDSQIWRTRASKSPSVREGGEKTWYWCILVQLWKNLNFTANNCLHSLSNSKCVKQMENLWPTKRQVIWHSPVLFVHYEQMFRSTLSFLKQQWRKIFYLKVHVVVVLSVKHISEQIQKLV